MDACAWKMSSLRSDLLCYDFLSFGYIVPYICGDLTSSFGDRSHCYHHSSTFVHFYRAFLPFRSDRLVISLFIAVRRVRRFFRIWNCCLLKLDGVIDTAYFLYKKLARGYIREVCDEKQKSRLGGLQLWWVSKLMSPTSNNRMDDEGTTGTDSKIA